MYKFVNVSIFRKFWRSILDHCQFNMLLLISNGRNFALIDLSILLGDNVVSDNWGKTSQSVIGPTPSASSSERTDLGVRVNCESENENFNKDVKMGKCENCVWLTRCD